MRDNLLKTKSSKIEIHKIETRIYCLNKIQKILRDLKKSKESKNGFHDPQVSFSKPERSQYSEPNTSSKTLSEKPN